MSDRWDGMLGPWLSALAETAARRRFAHERAEDEDAGDLDVEDEVARLAAADADRVYRAGAFAVRVADGRATQVAGPAGLALRIAGRLVPMSPGVAVDVGAIGDALHGVDARGRKLRLE